MDNFISDELLESFKKLNELWDVAYEELKPRVVYIIKNKIQNEYIIEHMFDEIINIPTDKCYQLFILFCEYVSMFNKEIVKEYIDIYDDLYGPIDKDKILKKIK